MILPDCALAVSRRVGYAYDESGYPMPGAFTEPVAPLPARKVERADHSWMLALDPSMWPVEEGDRVVEPSTGAEWLIVSADLLTNTADPAVDYVRCEAEARVGQSTVPPGVNPVGPT